MAYLDESVEQMRNHTSVFHEVFLELIPNSHITETYNVYKTRVILLTEFKKKMEQP